VCLRLGPGRGAGLSRSYPNASATRTQRSRCSQGVPNQPESASRRASAACRWLRPRRRGLLGRIRIVSVPEPELVSRQLSALDMTRSCGEPRLRERRAIRPLWTGRARGDAAGDGPGRCAFGRDDHGPLGVRSAGGRRRAPRVAGGCRRLAAVAVPPRGGRAWHHRRRRVVGGPVRPSGGLDAAGQRGRGAVRGHQHRCPLADRRRPELASGGGAGRAAGRRGPARRRHPPACRRPAARLARGVGPGAVRARRDRGVDARTGGAGHQRATDLARRGDPGRPRPRCRAGGVHDRRRGRAVRVVHAHVERRGRPW
jgi:hypothetical protein